DRRVDIGGHEQRDTDERPVAARRSGATEQKDHKRADRHETGCDQLRGERVGQQHGEKIESCALKVVEVVPDLVWSDAGTIDDGLEEIEIMLEVVVAAAGVEALYDKQGYCEHGHETGAPGQAGVGAGERRAQRS